MKVFRGLVLGACIIGLGACSNYQAHSEVKALNEAQAVGSPFTQYLAGEYRDFTNRELNEMFDYPDALHFARKGLAAAAGEVVMPEPISDWNLNPQHMEELSTARGRLVVAFDLGAREVAAQQSAIAQARFDCWIEQQEENWQDNDIAQCKSQFLDAMNALEGMVKPAPVMEPVADLAPEPSEPMKVEDAMYLVFFDFDKSAVAASGESVLDAVGQEVKSRSLNAVSVVGHTDRAGSRTYNNRLALKRANSVREALINRGVDAGLIKVDGRGEDQNLVQTDDNVREPANRRAEITFQ
ncbi:MAG: OmpA family protein [Micavibrio sp.]